MADYTGGYTSAVDAQSRRDWMNAETARLVNALAMLKRDDEQQQKDIADAKRARVQGAAQLAGMVNGAPGGAGQPPGPPQGQQPPAAPTASMQAMFGPQSPMPGQSSQPMQQKPPAPGTATPSPMPMEPWKAMPGAPAAAPGQMLGNEIKPPQPQEAMDMIMRGKTIDPLDMFKTLTKQGARPEDALAQVEQMAPLLNAHNKGVLEDLRINMEVDKRSREERAILLKEAAERRASANTASLIESRGERLDLQRQKLGGRGAGGGGGGGAASGYANTPQRKAIVDWYATMDIGGDRSWRVGLSQNKQGKEIIRAVDERVPFLGQEMGLTAADVGTNKAKRVANQSALTQITKDISSIKPFAAMLDQNVEILKGLARKVVKTDSPMANKTLNWLQTHPTSNPDLQEYMAQMRLVQTEAARVITNPRLVGQLTDTARDELAQIVNGEMSLGSTDRVLDRLKNDSERRVGRMEDQQKTLQSEIKGMMTGDTKATSTEKTVNWSDLK